MSEFSEHDFPVNEAKESPSGWVEIDGKKWDLPPVPNNEYIAPKLSTHYEKAPTLQEEAASEAYLLDELPSKVLPPDENYEGGTIKVMGENGGVYVFHRQTEAQKKSGFQPFTMIAESEDSYLRSKK